MAEKYFLHFYGGQGKGPYFLPQALKDELLKIDGLTILNRNLERGLQLPTVIIEMDKDKIDQVKSLEGVVSLYDNIQFARF